MCGHSYEIDAAGKYLMPGLTDMHVHLPPGVEGAPGDAASIHMRYPLERHRVARRLGIPFAASFAISGLHLVMLRYAAMLEPTFRDRFMSMLERR